MAFETGYLAIECAWLTIVFLPNGDNKYLGTGVIEVLCKVIAIILERCLEEYLGFYVILHGFLDKIGTRTANINAKLLHNISDLRQEVLYEIFIHLHKAYDALDREQNLKIMEVYEVSPQVFRLLDQYWGRR